MSARDYLEREMRDNERKCLLNPVNGELRAKAVSEDVRAICAGCRADFTPNGWLVIEDDETRDAPCAYRFRNDESRPSARVDGSRRCTVPNATTECSEDSSPPSGRSA
jgi:hypothetical protein